MTKLTASFGSMVLAAGLLVSGGCTMMHKHHDEHREGAAKAIPQSSVPRNVMDSVNKRFPGATVRNVEREIENGNVVYDFELTQNGRKYETDVKEDGTMMETEIQVANADMPDAVKRAIETRYPGARIQEVMVVNKVMGSSEKPDHYEVTLTTSEGKSKEVTVPLTGGMAKEEGEEPRK